MNAVKNYFGLEKALQVASEQAQPKLDAVLQKVMALKGAVARKAVQTPVEEQAPGELAVAIDPADEVDLGGAGEDAAQDDAPVGEVVEAETGGDVTEDAPAIEPMNQAPVGETDEDVTQGLPAEDTIPAEDVAAEEDPVVVAPVDSAVIGTVEDVTQENPDEGGETDGMPSVEPVDEAVEADAAEDMTEETPADETPVVAPVAEAVEAGAAEGAAEEIPAGEVPADEAFDETLLEAGGEVCSAEDKAVIDAAPVDAEIDGTAQTAPSASGYAVQLGTPNTDVLAGTSGPDILFGGAGDDALGGGEGNDVLVGGAGNDLLLGGAGDDLLFGNEGTDVFVMNASSGHDVVFDFMAGEDRLRIEGVGADAVTASANADGHLVLNYGDSSATLLGYSEADAPAILESVAATV